MASRKRQRPRRRYWRDVPLAVVLLGLFVGAAGFSYSVYFVDWSSAWQAAGKQPPQGQQTRSKADDDRIYTGSILVPERRDFCWQYGFDNRNGAMWNLGLVDCYESRLDYVLKEKTKGVSDERLLAIKKSLGHGGK